MSLELSMIRVSKPGPVQNRSQAAMVKGEAKIALRWLSAVAVGLGEVLGPSVGHSDEVPGVGDTSFYHYSKSLAPISITLRHIRMAEGSDPVLTIPRAYVYFADSAPENAPLPAKLATNSAGLALIDRTAEPWTLAVETRAQLDGKGKHEAALALRPERITVKLHSSTNPHGGEELRSALSSAPDLIRDGEYEGLPRFQSKGAFVYFAGSKEDDFSYARCPEPPRPERHCTYNFGISARIMGQATFADFRISGGRALANQRLRLIRDTVARYIVRP